VLDLHNANKQNSKQGLFGKRKKVGGKSNRGECNQSTLYTYMKMTLKTHFAQLLYANKKITPKHLCFKNTL
jgi:hypothetical protein